MLVKGSILICLFWQIQRIARVPTAVHETGIFSDREANLQSLPSLSSRGNKSNGLYSPIAVVTILYEGTA